MLTSDINRFQSKGFFLIGNKCCLISHGWHRFNRIHWIRTIRPTHYKNKNLVTKGLDIWYISYTGKKKKSICETERNPLVPRKKFSSYEDVPPELNPLAKKGEWHRVKHLKESEKQSIISTIFKEIYSSLKAYTFSLWSSMLNVFLDIIHSCPDH